VMPTEFSPMDISEHLDSPEMIVGYLRETFAYKDPNVFLAALADVEKALKRMTDSDVRMKNPLHPGGFVKTEILEPLGLSMVDAAKVLNVSGAHLRVFLTGDAPLSPDLAARLAKAFGLSMDTLLRMQNAYDIAEAHRRESEIAVERFGT
jgi:antitoxin HigA-1